MIGAPEDQAAAQGATPEEAAAVVAAIARFAAETAAPPADPLTGGGDRWLRAARLECAGGDPGEPGPWGDSHPWGRPAT